MLKSTAYSILKKTGPIWGRFDWDIMPDPFTRKKRSEIMSKIRSTGTKIELTMKKALEDAGIGFQYQPKLYGKPDFSVHPRIAVFCDSSFWHGRSWSKLKKKLPAEYWYDHIKNNRKRDAAVNRRLKKEGFAVLRFWDTEINSAIGDCINKIKKTVRSQHKGSAGGGLVVCC
jgi:DNA mismatch endonuclease (patch repair protein)